MFEAKFRPEERHLDPAWWRENVFAKVPRDRIDTTSLSYIKRQASRFGHWTNEPFLLATPIGQIYSLQEWYSLVCIARVLQCKLVSFRRVRTVAQRNRVSLRCFIAFSNHIHQFGSYRTFVTLAKDKNLRTRWLKHHFSRKIIQGFRQLPI